MNILSQDTSSGPILAHTDALTTLRLVPKSTNRSGIVSGHIKVIHDLADGRSLWMPTFNYDFLRSGEYSIGDSPSQVGAINEEFRRTSQWRSETPVFNFAGNDGYRPKQINNFDEIDPFDESSIFGELVRLDGTILWYGAPISAATFLHYVESLIGDPLYRYDKFFAGSVERNAHEALSVTLKYHVRPLSGPVAYDWDRISQDAMANGVIRAVTLTDKAPVYTANAIALAGYWQNRLMQDPLYFLDVESRSWIEPKIDELGRRFVISDFEEDVF